MKNITILNNRKNQQHVQGQSQQQQNLKPRGIYESSTLHVSNTSRTFVTLFNKLQTLGQNSNHIKVSQRHHDQSTQQIQIQIYLSWLLTVIILVPNIIITTIKCCCRGLNHQFVLQICSIINQESNQKQKIHSINLKNH